MKMHLEWLIAGGVVAWSALAQAQAMNTTPANPGGESSTVGGVSTETQGPLGNNATVGGVGANGANTPSPQPFTSTPTAPTLPAPTGALPGTTTPPGTTLPGTTTPPGTTTQPLTPNPTPNQLPH